jgi:hypothetical protein
MRTDRFLRTPIKAEQQGGIDNVEVCEVPLTGDPDLGDQYPQTLEISFDVRLGATTIEVSPLWAGELGFRPDPTVTFPDSLEQVTGTNVPRWNATGELILSNHGNPMGDLAIGESFKKHVPLIAPPPDTVVYSKVRLTGDFLFTTLRALAEWGVVFDGANISPNDEFFHQKLVIAFLKGAARVPCRHHQSDSAQDSALLERMPEILLAAVGLRTTLRITVATVAPEIYDRNWFDQREYDDPLGEQLPHPDLRNPVSQMVDPRHPSHSVVPARLVFQAAAPGAYSDDNPPDIPLRVVLATQFDDGRRYRRIDLIRPPIPGPEVSSAPQRPYPAYQLCWTPIGSNTTESLRLPLSGRLYLPLADGSYKFWVIRRSEIPQAGDEGSDEFRISAKALSPAQYAGPTVAPIGLPERSLIVDLGPEETETIYAHLKQFDERYAWTAFQSLTDRRRKRLKKASEDKWNTQVLDWYVFSRQAAYAPLYGYIRESAGRHHLAPEFLQVVFFGEGGNDAIDSRPGFNANEVLGCFDFVGLDLIVYRTGNVPASRPSHPAEIDALPQGVERDLELAEYYLNLVAKGYVDSETGAAVTWTHWGQRQEPLDNPAKWRTLELGTVDGWEAAIELVAAELHARLDEMVEYCAAHALPIDTRDELKCRFLSYIRYNTNPTRARELAAQEVKPWEPARPPDNLNPHYNTIQRIAVTQWHERVRAYR